MALDADRGFRRNLGTGKSLSFVRLQTMSIPQDVITWVEHNFSRSETELALSMLDTAVIEDGSPASPRLLRCAAVGSRGQIDRLALFIKELRVDWRDVIVGGEYEMSGDNLVRVHDFEQPIEA